MRVLIEVADFVAKPALHTVNPQKRPAGLILSLRVQMRVLLEFGPNFCIFAYRIKSFPRVLFKGRSLSRIYGTQGLTDVKVEIVM